MLILQNRKDCRKQLPPALSKSHKETCRFSSVKKGPLRRRLLLHLVGEALLCSTPGVDPQTLVLAFEAEELQEADEAAPREAGAWAVKWRWLLVPLLVLCRMRPLLVVRSPLIRPRTGFLPGREQ